MTMLLVDVSEKFKVVAAGFLCFCAANHSFLAHAQGLPFPAKPVWEQAPTESIDSRLQWTAVQQFGELPPQFSPIPARFKPGELAALPRVEGPYRSRGIYGVGGGVRTGSYTGDSTAAFITGRVGYKLDDNFAISIRPTGIYGPSDDNNNSNNNYDDGFEFRLPVTLDLFHSSFISPYIGGGIATNVDNLGYTDGMLTGGVDINITKWVSIGLNANYIYQSNIDDTDWEALGMIYLRF